MKALEPHPFHEVAGRRGERRLLLLSYHFPPGKTAGALRWQKLASHAAERGWQLDVITLDPASLSNPDMGRLDDLPPGTRVYGIAQVRAPEQLPEAVGRLARWLKPRRAPRQNTEEGGSRGVQPTAAPQAAFVSAADVRWLIRTPAELRRAASAWNYLSVTRRWALDAAALARRILKPGSHRAIVTCGPPHMEHEAGRRLARWSGLPLVMDFRDPWSITTKLPEPFASRHWVWATARYERRAVAAATLVVANTEHMRRSMLERYPDLQDRLVTVMNGYDEEYPATPQPGKQFLIAFTGNIYIDRDPRPLFRAVGRLAQELGLTPETFGMEFMGYVNSYGGVPTERLAREAGVESLLTLRPPGPHAAVHQLLGRATLLVSLPQDSPNAIPSKIFEYMQYRAWLLVFAHPSSAPALLLQQTQADVVEAADTERLVQVLRTRILQHRAGQRPGRVVADGRFSRREQARLLFDALEARLGEAAVRVPQPVGA